METLQNYSKERLIEFIDQLIANDFNDGCTCCRTIDVEDALRSFNKHGDIYKASDEAEDILNARRSMEPPAMTLKPKG